MARRPTRTDRRPRAATAGSGSERRPVPRPSSATILMLVAVLLGVAVLAPTVTQLIEQRQRISDLQQSLTQTQQNIDALTLEQARWTDPAYVQAQARGRLLFVKPGETNYLVVDSAPTAAPTQPTSVSVEQHETESNWLQTFTQSVVTSGTTNTPADEGEAK